MTETQLRRKRNAADQAAKEYEVKQLTHAAALKAAQAAIDAAEENVRLAQINLDLAKNVDRNAVTEIEKKVAEETLEQSVLRTPKARIGGSGKFRILKILVEPGEFITQLPVMQIGDVSRMTCVAEVYEADVKDVKEGQWVTIHSPALAGDFADGDPKDPGKGGLPGRVVRVGSLVAGAGLMQRNPLAPSDRSIVEVLIEIGNEDPEETAQATEEAAAPRRHAGDGDVSAPSLRAAARPTRRPAAQGPTPNRQPPMKAARRRQRGSPLLARATHAPRHDDHATEQ